MPEPDRLAPMMRRLRSLAVGLVPALLLVACTAAPTGPATPGSPTAPSASLSASPVETPGAIGGNPGVTPVPAPGSPGSSGGAIPAPSPTTVQPVANLKSVHDVRATEVTASMNGDHLTATVRWWSGPAPCSSLSAVAVVRTGAAFQLTVREGAEQLGVACPALAMFKQTIVDLGPVVHGTYSVAVLGIDQPIMVVYAS